MDFYGKEFCKPSLFLRSKDNLTGFSQDFWKSAAIFRNSRQQYEWIFTGFGTLMICGFVDLNLDLIAVNFSGIMATTHVLTDFWQNFDRSISAESIWTLNCWTLTLFFTSRCFVIASDFNLNFDFQFSLFMKNCSESESAQPKFPRGAAVKLVEKVRI